LFAIQTVSNRGRRQLHFRHYLVFISCNQEVGGSSPSAGTSQIDNPEKKGPEGMIALRPQRCLPPLIAADNGRYLM